eukprot:1147018-Prorocentrum_minimum.AAC.2
MSASSNLTTIRIIYCSVAICVLESVPVLGTGKCVIPSKRAFRNRAHRHKEALSGIRTFPLCRLSGRRVAQFLFPFHVRCTTSVAPRPLSHGYRFLLEAFVR